MSNAKDTAHCLRAMTTSATKINASSILTTTDRIWHGLLITVTVLCFAYCGFYCLSIIHTNPWRRFAKLYFLRNNANICDCLRFQILEKWAILRLPMNVQNCFSFRGALPPPPGALPWTPLGAPSPDPRYRLALHASPWPPFTQS